MNLAREAVSTGARDLAVEPAFLRHLISVEDADSSPPLNLDVLRSQLQFPSSRTFRGRQLGCGQRTGFPSRCSSPVERIYLKDSRLDTEGLRKLLTACLDLRTFEIDWDTSTAGDISTKMSLLGDAFRTLGTRLQNLRLDPNDAPYFDEPASPIGSLALLSSLQTLEIPHTTLFGKNKNDPEAYQSFTDI